MKNLYDGKRVAILRGYPRLIDGESTSVEEMYDWGLKNNVEFFTYYYHPVWKKSVKEYNDGYKHPHKKFNRNMIEEVLLEINNFDLVLLVNPPQQHSKLTPQDILEFHKMYKKINVIKVQMQHTSFMRTMKKTPFQWSYANESDAVYNHSDESEYMIDLVKKLPSKQNRAYPMHLWSDIKKYESYYNNTDRLSNITYIGRPVAYKGHMRLLDMAEQLVNNNIKPVIYGMDTSIGCKNSALVHKNCNNLLQPNSERSENPIVDTYGKVNREDVLKIFNKSLFACTLFKFRTDSEKTFYGDRLEYTMQEAIMAGAILVVDKSWAECCKTSSGIRYCDIKNFAIMMDENNPDEAIKTMTKVLNDDELQNIYRTTAFNILKEEYDNLIILPKLMNELFSITKDTSKFKDDYELVKYLTSSSEMADKFIEMYNAGYLMAMAPKYIDKNKISFFGGKSGKAVISL